MSTSIQSQQARIIKFCDEENVRRHICSFVILSDHQLPISYFARNARLWEHWRYPRCELVSGFVEINMNLQYSSSQNWFATPLFSYHRKNCPFVNLFDVGKQQMSNLLSIYLKSAWKNATLSSQTSDILWMTSNGPSWTYFWSNLIDIPANATKRATGSD